jgi:plasmid rolling circle replication initiator protein Rep
MNKFLKNVKKKKSKKLSKTFFKSLFSQSMVSVLWCSFNGLMKFDIVLKNSEHKCYIKHLHFLLKTQPFKKNCSQNSKLEYYEPRILLNYMASTIIAFPPDE